MRECVSLCVARNGNRESNGPTAASTTTTTAFDGIVVVHQILCPAVSLTLTSRSFLLLLHSHTHAAVLCVCMSHGLQKSGSYSYKRGRACHRKENGRKSGYLIIELNDDEGKEERVETDRRRGAQSCDNFAKDPSN